MATSEQATAQELQAQEWVEATQTVTPVPTEQVETFKASFQTQLECSPMVDYVGPEKVRCAQVYLEATAEAGQ